MTDYRIEVKTSNRKGAGTDSAVFLILIDKNGTKSEPQNLDKFFTDEFERGNVDCFDITVNADLAEIQDIELYHESWGFLCEWHLEYISVEHIEQKGKIVYPFHRWVVQDVHYMIEPYDCSLPQNSRYREQRDAELKRKRVTYTYKEAFPGLPLQVGTLPDDEKLSDVYEITLGKFTSTLMMETLWVSITKEDAESKFESIDDVASLFDSFRFTMPTPKYIENWEADETFGFLRINGCNPGMIKLCTAIPEGFAVDAATLKPLLENKTVDEAIAAKKLFIIDITILDGLPTKDDAWVLDPFTNNGGVAILTFVHTTTNNNNNKKLTSPYCLLYLNDASVLLPVAIQLFKDPSETNPVFYPSDDKNLWTLAKMWYCLGDSAYHQAAAHLGGTHLMMEGLCVAMNRTMSLSHPVHKLLAPHFLFLLAINDSALQNLVSPGGWIDMTMAYGHKGVLTLAARRFEHYDLANSGDFKTEIKHRGVDDPNVLPNYHYREDATLLYDIIKMYATNMVKHFYASEADIKNDTEVQAWGKELVTPKPEGLGYQGVPNGGNFVSHDDLASLLTYIIFSCSVQHAAVNFAQYDNYAFPPAYPVRMVGSPPTTKDPIPREDLTKTLNNKEHMMQCMVVTKLLSERGTQPLGDFEVIYHHDPAVVEIVDQFRADLKTAGSEIAARDKARKVPYEILHPGEIPNAISI